MSIKSRKEKSDINSIIPDDYSFSCAESILKIGIVIREVYICLYLM